MQKLLIAIRSQVLTNALVQALTSRFEAHCCGTGADVYRLVDNLRPDALILDLRLPDGDGFSVLRSCRHKPPVILAITDFVSCQVRQLAADAGIHGLIMMPCSARYIAEMLERTTVKIPSPER